MQVVRIYTGSDQQSHFCGDGTTRRFKPGDVMLADDLTGQGHQSRVVGNEPYVFIAVPLAE